MKATSHCTPGEIAVLYVRVSTDEQAQTGYSLQDQERKLRAWCEANQMEVDRVYREDHSAKTFKRPAFLSLVEYLTNQKRRIKHLLVLKWDRFSRNTEASFAMINAMKRLGVEVTAIEQPIDDSIPEMVIMKALLFAVPEAENLRRAKNVKDGMIQAMREGRWVRRAPKGYRNAQYDNGRVKVIEPDDDAPRMRQAFRMVLDGSSQEDARRFLVSKGVQCSRSQFQRLVRNPVYAGFIMVPESDAEPAHMVDGLHEAIIPYEEWLAIQDVLDERQQKRDYSRSKSEVFPLRGHLICEECSGKLTGSVSKGNCGGYAYYHGYKGCHARYPVDVVHSAFDSFLDNLKVDPAIAELHVEILRDTVQYREKEGRKLREKLSRQLSDQIELLEKAEDTFIRGDIGKDAYVRAKGRYEKKMRELEYQIRDVSEFEAEFLDHIERGFGLLTRLKELYHAVDVSLKSRILGSIWPEKLAFDGESFRTSRENQVMMLLTNNGKGFSRSTKKRAAQIGDSSRLVRPTGFEPVFSA